MHKYHYVWQLGSRWLWADVTWRSDIEAIDRWPAVCMDQESKLVPTHLRISRGRRVILDD